MKWPAHSCLVLVKWGVGPRRQSESQKASASVEDSQIAANYHHFQQNVH
jgi:hypothetical protein